MIAITNVKWKSILRMSRICALMFSVIVNMHPLCEPGNQITVPNDYKDSTIVWVEEGYDHKVFLGGSLLEVISNNLILATYDSTAQTKNCRVAHLVSSPVSYVPPNDSLTAGFVYDKRVNQPYGLDSVWSWMLDHRTIINNFTSESMGVYVCLFYRFYTIEKDGSTLIPLPTGETRMLAAWDSLNEACCAINYGHYYDIYFNEGYDLSKIDSIFELVVAHEIGHAFHANESYEDDTAHCSVSTCIMHSPIDENLTQEWFCPQCMPRLKERKP